MAFAGLIIADGQADGVVPQLLMLTGTPHIRLWEL